jgi:hypothetical protein
MDSNPSDETRRAPAGIGVWAIGFEDTLRALAEFARHRRTKTMTEIRRSKDCGNSPKNQLLQNLVLAFARADVSQISELVTSDVRWLPVGRNPVSGAEAIAKAITHYGPATRITIDHVISHGKAGAVNGVIEFGRERRAFCYVFEFGSAKGSNVCGITSYSVALG